MGGYSKLARDGVVLLGLRGVPEREAGVIRACHDQEHSADEDDRKSPKGAEGDPLRENGARRCKSLEFCEISLSWGRSRTWK